MQFVVTTVDHLYRLSAHVQLIGEDLLVAVQGGDKPHIGAVAVAQPRLSLDSSHDKISASTSVICLVGHKEDVLAKAAAETLAAVLNRPVVVTAGMHWDQIREQGIKQVEENARQLIDQIIEELTVQNVINDGVREL
jgi:hypothetical protein